VKSFSPIWPIRARLPLFERGSYGFRRNVLVALRDVAEARQMSAVADGPVSLVNAVPHALPKGQSDLRQPSGCPWNFDSEFKLFQRANQVGA